MIDLYSILGVRSTATIDDIRKAYRGIALRCHPDRKPGDKKAEAEFKRASAAYDILADDKKRGEYDAFRACPVPNPPPPRSRPAKAPPRPSPDPRSGGNAKRSPGASSPFEAFTEAFHHSDMMDDILRAAADQRRNSPTGRCPVCRGRKTLTVHLGLFIMGMPCPLCAISE